MGRRTIVIETRGDICMSDRDNPRSLVEIMNDVLSTVREHYDSEYVYYIEKEYEDIDVIYEWCAKHVPWQRDKIKMLPKDQRPRWMEQEITDTTEDSYSVFRRLDENTVAILAAVGVHRGGCEVDLLRSVLAYLPEAITLQKLQKQQEYLSYHDKLTGLYNRNSFVSYTTDINPDELNSLGAVSVDINGLKNFNKEFGRDYGDEVVIRVGEVLEEYFHTANVYRMTGDEYLVLVENITYDKTMSEKVREDILNSIPLANGMIQAGERIVDRGEIIDNHTYNVLRSLKIVHETKSGGAQRQGIIMGGQFVLVFGILFCFWLYLWSFRLKILHNRRNALFLVLCVFVSCILTELCVTYGLFNVYILPFAIVPIVVRTFFDSRTALFTHLIIVLICSLMVPFPHEFLLLQVIAGMVVTFSLRDLYERSQLIRCAFFIFMSYALCYISLSIYQEADFKKINWMMMLYFGINFILLMFTYILVYMLEKTFGYVSSITLVELSNINTPILKKLSEISPGTFQHSLQMSILASEAAAAIGANAQLVRTGAMYHDIGKMANPAFFTENQSSINPHSQLSFDQSAKIIINHVNDGVKIAEKAMLPKAIIDFIRTHHGRGKAKYFYNSFKNQYPDREIDEEAFTYPGPNPFSKETAVLMMADSVEAASRSLKEHTEENIRALVDKIIDGQIADGLMRNAPLTFKDVETVKNVFVEKLKIMYHTRISYPDLKK